VNDLGAVDYGRVVVELDLLQHLAGFGVESEEGVPVRIGIPDRFFLVVPDHVVRAIARQRPHVLDDPALAIDHEDVPGRRTGVVEQSVLVDDAVSPCTAGALLRLERHLAVRQSTTAAERAQSASTTSAASAPAASSRALRRISRL